MRIIYALIIMTFCLNLAAAEVPLAKDGAAAVSIVVAQEALDLDIAQRAPDQELLMLRWAAEDLATYIGRITGAAPTVGSEPVAGTVPIYVGNAPQAPALQAESEFGDAYAIDTTAQRIALIGETPRAVYYAAAHLLHSLGVRWYAPTELGEVVPTNPQATLTTGRVDTAPSFHTRGLWADKRWALRNRMGGPQMAQGHAFHGFMKDVDFEKHPDYFPIINGKPVKYQANLSHPEVVKRFVDGLRERLAKGTNWAGNGAAIGPDDGALLDERPESMAMDSGQIDPFLQLRCSTDRFVKFCNQIANELEEEFPDRYFGFYVYSNHNLPPKTVKPHRMLFPIVAPITYNRYTSVGHATSPTSPMLEEVTKAWAELSPRIGCYLYNFNLGDTAMPFTRTLAWSLTFPRLHEWGLRYATIESMDDNWHFQVPGNYVLGHLLWDVGSDTKSLLDDFYASYYGPAAEPMRRYNETLETAYETTNAYAGNIWSMHRILTPDLMQTLHEALAQAETAAQADATIAARVKVSRYSVNFADHYLAARQALNDGELTKAKAAADAYQANYEAGSKEYPRFIGRLAGGYFAAYAGRSFLDAGRIAAEGRVLGAFPDEWDAFLDVNDIGENDAFYHPDRDTSSWIKLRTHGASLDEQGFPFYRGTIWYRHAFELPDDARAAERLNVWIGGVDDTARVWLNGKFLGNHGVGRFGPVDVDISEAVNREGRNVMAVAVSNLGITELGTGGICRPVFLHAPYKEGETRPDGATRDRPQPLFGGDVD